jgi:Na+/H+ antiporter NhaC
LGFFSDINVPLSPSPCKRGKIIYLKVLSLHSGGPLQAQLFAFSAIVVLIAVLVFGLPLAKGNHEHTEGFVLSPKPVLNAGTNEEFIVGIGMMDLTVQFQIGAVIEKMEKLISDLVRMQAGTFAPAKVRSTEQRWLRTTI